MDERLADGEGLVEYLLHVRFCGSYRHIDK